jgi:hypothetical protein
LEENYMEYLCKAPSKIKAVIFPWCIHIFVCRNSSANFFNKKNWVSYSSESKEIHLNLNLVALVTSGGK